MAQAGGLQTAGAAAAQQIAQSVTATVPSQQQAAAFSQGIQQALQAYNSISQIQGYTNQAEVTQLAGTIAVLVDAAESAKQDGAVRQAFPQVSNSMSQHFTHLPLQLFSQLTIAAVASA